jgi:prepilin-type N-terminal cleavage/methylation domain-containing protein
MKISKPKILLPKHSNSAGFTLVELLVSITIMGITSSLISYAIGSMISSNQALAKEQNRRTEISRAINLISDDIKLSTVSPVADIPSSITVITGTPILFLSPVSLNCTDTNKNYIVYTIQAQSDSTAIGPNVIYRYGLIPDANGNFNCGDAAQTTPVADAVSLGSLTAPSCVAPTGTDTSDFSSTGTNGFYSCVSDNQVTVALFTKFSGNKIYGVSQTTNSGAAVTVSSTAVTTCTVPDLLTGGTGGVPLSPTEANTAITGANLRYYAINTESGGSTVLGQNPLAGSKIPCNKGLVTYTY